MKMSKGRAILISVASLLGVAALVRAIMQADWGPALITLAMALVATGLLLGSRAKEEPDPAPRSDL
ncbi:hypothetical protein [Salsipaludibacter albus]|uniref:hypothetical protein n=1 Tax=Salsipaludibacter albus TaxID=2849650 RepID=UPI001EE3B5FE|nr:hypothetical protein [Salsipaludibacter albus]MBY5161137.1 hypothetical protein [Salsipaludibacter albus]